jgi:hypothetical protein
LSEEYKKELAFIREEDKKKIDFLMKQVDIKDKHIELLHSFIERSQKD